MVEVTIKPMADWMRKISPRLRPVVPPVFQKVGKGGVGAKDMAFARELFALLDEVSQAWYLGCCPGLFSGELEKPDNSRSYKETLGKIAEG